MTLTNALRDLIQATTAGTPPTSRRRWPSPSLPAHPAPPPPPSSSTPQTAPNHVPATTTTTITTTTDLGHRHQKAKMCQEWDRIKDPTGDCLAKHVISWPERANTARTGIKATSTVRRARGCGRGGGLARGQARAPPNAPTIPGNVRTCPNTPCTLARCPTSLYPGHIKCHQEHVYQGQTPASSPSCSPPRKRAGYGHVAAEPGTRAGLPNHPLRYRHTECQRCHGEHGWGQHGTNARTALTLVTTATSGVGNTGSTEGLVTTTRRTTPPSTPVRPGPVPHVKTVFAKVPSVQGIAAPDSGVCLSPGENDADDKDDKHGKHDHDKHSHHRPCTVTPRLSLVTCPVPTTARPSTPSRPRPIILHHPLRGTRIIEHSPHHPSLITLDTTIRPSKIILEVTPAPGYTLYDLRLRLNDGMHVTDIACRPHDDDEEDHLPPVLERCVNVPSDVDTASVRARVIGNEVTGRLRVLLRRGTDVAARRLLGW